MRPSKATSALVYKNGTLAEEVSLKNERIIVLSKVQMKIEVKNEKIRVANSDCPQHLCMNMGWIKYSGQAIVCVPNKVVIEIKSAGPKIVDAVVY